MNLDSSTLLFFDASCLIAAAGSRKNGSSFLLSLCTRGLPRGAVSQTVLLEAERNIQAKLRTEALQSYHQLPRMTPLILTSTPSPEELRRFQDRVSAKDVHVIAAAVGVSADFLLTLDKPLVEQVQAAGTALVAVTPGVFITTVLPTHVDHARI